MKSNPLQQSIVIQSEGLMGSEIKGMRTMQTKDAIVDFYNTTSTKRDDKIFIKPLHYSFKADDDMRAKSRQRYRQSS